MTIEKNDRKSLIDYRLQQAEETISDVQLLIENDRLRSAVNRIYYGMFIEMQDFISEIKSHLKVG
ncbi:MAG: hypothetical protein B6I19_03790 [Bacteroidetes bacterium 4572_114]|nr:MAG: hypothetical protein B6I19_03790 [Bacteroidetes bacterium 4572_114]